MQIVDQSCSCELCVSRTTEMYHLPVTCGNCGERHIAKMRKGDTPSHSRDCPACGVYGRLIYGTLREATELMAQQEATT